MSFIAGSGEKAHGWFSGVDDPESGLERVRTEAAWRPALESS